MTHDPAVMSEISLNATMARFNAAQMEHQTLSRLLKKSALGPVRGT